MRAEVRELTSLETGVLGLHTGETVLFHLDQVNRLMLYKFIIFVLRAQFSPRDIIEVRLA